MADNSYRIRVKVGEDENVVRVNLKQGIKTLNILSLEINPEDEYDIQTADYGVIVGRVLANEAYGIPNVKVSVFIPIDEADKSNYIISNEYPYRTPQSYDINGVKYNLIEKKENSPGTFPSKRMVLDNDGMVEVFDKYWKYTTTTNQSGDYMIFGVPTGTCQVHYDCDLSDIGILSQHPYDFVARGYDKNLFKSMTEFNTTNLASAVHIKSQDKSVYVYPFWGNKERNQIGITRNDIKIDYEFRPSCVFMGSSITDPEGTYISTDGVPNGSNGNFDTLTTSVGDIEIIRKTQNGTVEELKDNVKGIIDGNGVWCYMIPMNLDRIGTDEFGNKIAINDPNKGIPTRARVRFRISLSTNNNPSGGVTAKMLVPCNPELEYFGGDKNNNEYYEPVPKGLIKIPYPTSEHNYPKDYIYPDDYSNIYEFGSKTPDAHFRDLYWGKVYSVKQYYPRFQYESDIKSVAPYNKGLSYYNNKDYLIQLDDPEERREMYNFTGYPPQYSFKQSVISSIYPNGVYNTFPYTTMYASAEVGIDESVRSWFLFHSTNESSTSETLKQKGLHFCFENDWINGCIYFPRILIIGGNYFGAKTDNGYDYGDERGVDTREHASTGYTNVYISGRHNWYWKDNKFTVREELLGVTGENQKSSGFYKGNFNTNLLSVFTRATLKSGIITKKKTNIGQDVFYYRCGALQLLSNLPDKQKVDNIKNEQSLSFRRLYSTDIILLGNLEDLYDSLPKLYKSLNSTTVTFPPIAPEKTLLESGMSKFGYRDQILSINTEGKEDKDQDLIDIFNWTGYSDYDNFVQATSSSTLYAVVQDEISNIKSDNDRYIYALGNDYDSSYGNSKMLCALSKVTRCTSLFFGMRVWQLDDMLVYDIPTFVNTSRICELDVHNDSQINVIIDKDGRNFSIPIPTNGIIDVYDIDTFENRSAFATMNYNINSYSLDSLNHRKFKITPLVINGFDGRLKSYVDSNYFTYTESNTGKELKHAIDDIDASYMKFRFGYYDKWNGPFTQRNIKHKNDNYLDYDSGPLYLTQNSFYFYFGLRSGFSALDALNENFIGDDSYKKGYDSSSSNVSYVNIEQIKEKVYCEGGISMGDCRVEIDGLSFPVTYEIYMGVYLVKKGEISTSSFIISGLQTGSYKLKITDAKENKIEKQFSILEYGKTATFSKGYDRTSDLQCPYVVIESVNDNIITSVSGYSGTTWVKLNNNIVYNENIDHDKIRISYSIGDYGTGSEDVILDVEFSVEFVKILITGDTSSCKPTIFFDEGVQTISVNLHGVEMNYLEGNTSEKYDQDCLNTQYNIDLVNSFNLSLQLNDVPVKYITGWSEYFGYNVDQCEPDSLITGNGYDYNVFDSVNVLHPDRTVRCFDFTGIEYEKQLEYMSKMFSYICGEKNMVLSNNGDTGNIILGTLSPNISTGDGVYDYYTTPYKNWESGKLTGDTLQRTTINGVSYGSQDIPHIVGSNYPRIYRDATFLKEGAFGSGDFDWFQYVNNKSFTGGTDNNLFYFGASFFGCRDSQNSELDEPGSGITPEISSETLGTYELSNDIKEMLAIRTVDKRFDYQFNIRTPLLLPSGYDLFTNLSEKSIYSGYAWLQLYGGIRLDYDNDTKELTSYTKEIRDYSKDYLTFTALEDTTFTFTQNTLKYSLNNGRSWKELSDNTASPTVTAGEKILWKQTGLTPKTGEMDDYGIGTFSSTGKFYISGNIMSLYYGDSFEGEVDLTGKNYAFYSMFSGCTNLEHAKNLILPATTLANYCYNQMFTDCISLKTSPEILPATTLASGCCESMFCGCTLLRTVPNVLPATTLDDWCYQNMFTRCTSLTTAPVLPATTLTNSCYRGMFEGCMSLIKAPELSAATLVESCYDNMFTNCESLNYIKCLATDISATDCTTNWLYEVASEGTFIKADSMEYWTRGVHGIPDEWSIEVESNATSWDSEGENDEFDYLDDYILNGGPTSGASLWGESIYESDSSDYDLYSHTSVTTNNIWGLSPQNQDDGCDVFDIDNVEYKISKLGHKSSFFNAEFKGCSTDFGNGYVKEGDGVSFKVSYDSPIEIVREGEDKFNLGYYIRIASGETSTSGTVSATLSGASLTLKIKPDNNWNGLTYTDVISGDTGFDDGNYPYWALQSGVCISSTSCTNSGCKRLLFGLYDSYNLSQNGDEIQVGDEMTTFNFIGNAANIKIPDVTESNYHFVSAYYDNGNDFQPIDDKSLQDKGTFYFSGETSNITSDFLLIPSRKIYANTKYGTSLKQGVVFNLGYAYYSGPITYDYSCINDSVEIKIRLKTPLRGSDDTINYETHYLSGHTIGKVENCDLKTTGEGDSSVVYDESRCKFTITGEKTISKYRLYFDIVNGFRYKIIIDNSGNSGGGGTSNIEPIPNPTIDRLTPITTHPDFPGGGTDSPINNESEHQYHP